MAISLENHLKHPCSESHTIDMVVPEIDPSKKEVQHPEWVGRACDCNRLIYEEGMCHCPAEKKWEIHWQPNPNY